MIKEYKSIIIAIIAGLSAIICFAIAVSGLTGFKQMSKSSGFNATGSASRDFVADLIVWRGEFTVNGPTTKAAYANIKQNSEIIRQYLHDNGVTDEEMTFFSVDIYHRYKNIYNDDGNIIDEVSAGYDLSQQFAVSSYDVDKIETISRDITELIDSGVELVSESPEYYYTKLDELKLELIEEATQNARQRINLLAENSGSKVGELLSANLGVFQITGQNSDSDEYSYGGAFNTTSKGKTASITVKLNYTVK